MSYVVANPEDKFSRDEAQLNIKEIENRRYKRDGYEPVASFH